ncbi:MAG: dihydropteroate synthase [Phycisphaerae bacterium]|jgi:dihydropteroate synthase|nr:dihydropteroate synthase [Phycisphaerae bacterium]
MRFSGNMTFGQYDLDFSSRTLVMGILNITPDSFSDGGKFFDMDQAIVHGLEMANAGADILDIGGESTRPGSESISPDVQIRRVVPVIESLARQIRIPISIDTTFAQVARAALDAGASIINDISALRFDPSMVSLAAEKKVPVILMHMLGVPKTMQQAPYYDDVVSEVKTFLKERLEYAVCRGIDRGKIILDVGIGFGKRLEDNLKLLAHIEDFYDLNCPVLVGHSRKGFIGKISNQPMESRDLPTLAVSAFLASHHVHLLRVHDVASTRLSCQVISRIMSDISHPV